MLHHTIAPSTKYTSLINKLPASLLSLPHIFPQRQNIKQSLKFPDVKILQKAPLLNVSECHLRVKKSFLYHLD